MLVLKCERWVDLIIRGAARTTALSAGPAGDAWFLPEHEQIQASPKDDLSGCMDAFAGLLQAFLRRRDRSTNLPMTHAFRKRGMTQLRYRDLPSAPRFLGHYSPGSSGRAYSEHAIRFPAYLTSTTVLVKSLAPICSSAAPNSSR